MGGQWTSPTPRSETIHEQRPRLAKIPTLASIHIKTPTTPMPSLIKGLNGVHLWRLPKRQGPRRAVGSAGIRRKLAKAKYREVGGLATTPMPLPVQRAKWCPPLRLPNHRGPRRAVWGAGVRRNLVKTRYREVDVEARISR